MPRTLSLSQIQGEMCAHGRLFIRLKRAYLTEVVDADSAARLKGDIDLLVHQERPQDAARPLTYYGYSASKDFWFDLGL